MDIIDAKANWYVAQTHTRAELTAKAHLSRQGFGAYVPQYLKSRRHARKTEWVSAPLFPRYIFINLDIDNCRWQAINSTIGISHLVCQGNRPIAVPIDVINDIAEREDENGMIRLGTSESLSAGDAIKMLEGPFAGHEGLFSSVVGNERVSILLNLMGRTLRIYAPIRSVSALS